MRSRAAGEENPLVSARTTTVVLVTSSSGRTVTITGFAAGAATAQPRPQLPVSTRDQPSLTSFEATGLAVLQADQAAGEALQRRPDHIIALMITTTETETSTPIRRRCNKAKLSARGSRTDWQAMAHVAPWATLPHVPTLPNAGAALSAHGFAAKHSMPR